MAPTRVLYISGSIGLGHAGRDLAIAHELRRLDPSVEIVWLAGDPAQRLLTKAGETVLPESAAFAEETGSAEAEADGFSLNIVNFAAKVSRGAWKRAVKAFEEVSASYPYDVLVGDESYEVAIELAKRPELKRGAPFALIYDFVGMDATTWSPLERLIAYRINWLWSGGLRERPPSEDLILFIGEPDDIPDRRFGLLLPNRREHARRHYRFVGYAFPFDPADYADRTKVRAALGYDDRPLVVCSVGGTAVGADLLRLSATAYPHLERRLPGVRMVLVCGPRLDPASVAAPPGVELRGYVPRLYEHFAASDVTVVQGGGTTTLELTALRRPFLYFPLEGHFEQELVVAERVARHGAGRRQSYAETTPEALAEAIVSLVGQEPAWPPIATDGARRAAALIHELAGSGARRERLAHPERRQDDAEARAEAGRAVDVDAALVGADELAHDREPDAGAAGRARA